MMASSTARSAAAPARAGAGVPPLSTRRVAVCTVRSALGGAPSPAAPWGGAGGLRGSTLHPLPSPGRASSTRVSSRGARLAVRAAADYYQVLGVQRDADKKAIKAAYR